MMMKYVHTIHASELNSSNLIEIRETWNLDDVAQFMTILDRYAKSLEK